MDQTLKIYLASSVSKATLEKWRDSMSFIVIEKPAHGKLDEYFTTVDYVTYTPVEGVEEQTHPTYSALILRVFFHLFQSS